MSEEIYRVLVSGIDKNAPISVHLCDYPVCGESYIDPALEKNMDIALDIVTLGRAARNTAGIKNRQPIGLMYVSCGKGELPEEFKKIILDELNIKEILFMDNADGFSSYKFKPQLKTVGPKYGSLLPKINEALQKGDGNMFMDELNKTGEISFMASGEKVILTNEDLLIEASHKEGYAIESGKGMTVVLHTVLTEPLIEEGYVRELISKIQTMRKEAGFEVTDRITVSFSEETGDVIQGVFERNAEEIKNEVLADDICPGADGRGHVKQWNVNGREVTLGVVKL